MAWDKEKAKAWRKAYYQANREKIKAYNKAWGEANRERRAAYDLARRESVRERKNATSRAWHEANRERILLRMKKYRESNREKLCEQRRLDYKQNRERKRAYSKDWRTKNKNGVAEKRKANYKANRERERTRNKKWCCNNTHKVTEIQRRKRARHKNAFVSLTTKEKKKILLLESTRQELQKETGRPYHIDHILPIAHGGIHHPVNLQILDGEENLSKNAKLLPEAIALAPEHFRLYSERVSPERAWEFVRQLCTGLGLGEDDLNALVTGKPLKSKPTLEDFFT